MANPVFLDVHKSEGRIRDLATQLGFEVDPDAKVGDLSVGIQQRIEILKALYRGAKVLILDEPTAVLTPQETVEIFAGPAAPRRRGHEHRVHQPQAVRGARASPTGSRSSGAARSSARRTRRPRPRRTSPR